MEKTLNLLMGRQLSGPQLKALGVALDSTKLKQRPAVIVKKGRIFCQRCGFQAPRANYTLPDKSYYCPACLAWGRLTTTMSLYSIPEANDFKKYSQDLLEKKPRLSLWQKKAAKELLQTVKRKQERLLWAVTGAGKTEMLFEALNFALLDQQRVCLATPRVDVCNELYPRLCQAFPKVKSCLLYQNSGQEYTYTQLVVCTVHQLLRFYHAFDLLVIDEVDAFPYVNDRQLHYAVTHAKKINSSTLYLTATPDRYLKQQIHQNKLAVTCLPLRHHRHLLPEITLVKLRFPKQKIEERTKKYLIKWVKNKIPFLVFVPQIAMLKPILKELQHLWPTLNGECVSALDPDRLQKVKNLRAGIDQYLVTTTILERGITITRLNVMVLQADAPLFSETVLVQIAGRVGRDKDYPSGEVVFTYQEMTFALRAAKKQIKLLNQKAEQLLKNDEMSTL